MLDSIRNLYIYGPGPSSSHTIGPYRASLDFIKSNIGNFNFSKIEVTLYGSLALTGKGHGTDKIIKDTIEKEFNIKCDVFFNVDERNLVHPNTMLFVGYNDKNKTISNKYFSVGGGEIVKDDLSLRKKKEYIYPFSSFDDIKKYVKENKIDDLSQVADIFEDKDINSYLLDILNKMLKSVEIGLSLEGVLPGTLKLNKVAKKMYENALNINDVAERKEMLLSSFSYAVSENNADGKMIVTAPTCGSAGIIPSILYYYKKYLNTNDEKLINSLKVGAFFGLLAKQNASISGAMDGCQAEIGVASSMGAAILSYLNNLSIYQIEYASEVALEHFLGLTCDPVEGYVQIPCIERNGIGVLRSYASYLYAKNIAPLRQNRVSYDDVIKTMKMTGDDIDPSYKETSIGGLAKILKK